MEFEGGVLVAARLTINGTVSGRIAGREMGATLEGSQIDYVKDSTGETLLASGRIHTVCLSGSIDLLTSVPLSFPSGLVCPRSGEMEIQFKEGTLNALFGPDFQADLYLNDELLKSYANCQSPESCPN
jgi:hypothetical protein